MTTVRKIGTTVLVYLTIGFLLFITVAGFFGLIRGIVAFYIGTLSR